MKWLIRFAIISALQEGYVDMKNVHTLIHEKIKISIATWADSCDNTKKCNIEEDKERWRNPLVTL